MQCLCVHRSSSFRAVIAEAIRARQTTQVKLAWRAGMDAGALSQFLSGKRNLRSDVVETLLRIPKVQYTFEP